MSVLAEDEYSYVLCISVYIRRNTSPRDFPWDFHWDFHWDFLKSNAIVYLEMSFFFESNATVHQPIYAN